MELRDKQRYFLSTFFFLSGFCFSSWASRIPTIKTNFAYNEAELGTTLLFMPVSSLLGLPISGWMVSRFDSRVPLSIGFVFLAISMVGVAFAPTRFTLIITLCAFAFSMRILNIAMNTQALTVQKKFEHKINGSFHGLWSTGGIAGIGFSTFLVAFHISMEMHLLIVAVFTLVVTILSYPFLIQNDRTSTGNTLTFTTPDPYIVYLGLLVFLAAICEGGMFDWSGIFFKEVVKEELFTIGYLLFMICMALSRFATDYMVDMIGMAKMYVVSSLLIFIGIGFAVLLPTFWPSLIGFCLVGFGTASIIPMTFLLASGSNKYSPGIAISIIATYSIVGSFIGPPLIGYIAHATGLRISFITFAVSGLLLIPVSQLFFRHQQSLNKN